MRARRWLQTSPEKSPRPGSITGRSSRSQREPTRRGARLPMPKRSCRSTETMRGDRRRQLVVKACLVPIALGLLAAPASAQSLQIVGYSGYLGEWELTATVTENASGQIKEYSGPLTMKHVGLCTQDGPEE